jgi:hypothetical protein
VSEHEPRPRRLTDEQLIEQELELAAIEKRTITDAAARVIASQLHGGETSALYSLSSAGAIDEDGLAHELAHLKNDRDMPVEVGRWLEALESYAMHRESTAPVEDWHKLWLGPDGIKWQTDFPKEGES